MKGDADYRNITATVRTPRCAILINENSKYWKTAADSAIRHSSEIWGGRYFLLIPTDGHRIEETFWELLEAHSPDFIAEYRLTFADMQHAEPDLYAARKEEYRIAYERENFSFPDFEDWFRQASIATPIDQLSISAELTDQLINRLSPFQFGGRAVQHILNYRLGFRFPFTRMSAILPFARAPIVNIVLPKVPEDRTVALMVHSETGIASESYVNTLETLNIRSTVVPDDFSEWMFAERALGREPWTTLPDDGGWDLPPDYPRPTPFGISGLHLGRYYRTDKHMEYAEPIITILGDTVADFCLYYSLSRLHDDVHWLPLELLSGAYKSMTERRRRFKAEGAPIEVTPAQRFGTFLVNHLLRKLSFHSDGEKRFELYSMSLSTHQIRARKRQVLDLSYLAGDEYGSRVVCKEIADLPTECIGFVIEENNYVTFQSAVFIEGVSVSPVDTPKPKNFTKINVPEHNWLTSLTVENFKPPSLPSLGAQIIKIGGLAPDLRVANDGLVYPCPSVGYFGGDADVVTVRPKLALLDEMTILASYFKDAGITIKYSDKGNYFLDTVRRFGGLTQAGEFIKAVKTRGIIYDFVRKRKNADGSAVHLDTDQRTYLSFKAISLHVGDDSETSELIDRLIGKEVIERGVILQCERCRLSSWYSLGVLTAEFRCNRCALNQQFTRSHWKKPHEPQWYYKLAETVHQCFVHNSHLTIQVLHRLQQDSKEALHFTPEIDLIGYPPGSKSEIDLACVMDGEIILGECKTETLRPSHVEKYVALASRLRKRPDRIIFATDSEKISGEFRDKIKGIPGMEVLAFADLFDS
ncbi:hypothetical protein [Kribbella sp. NPDC051718]|uniref:hypothetical protein n=1 Tax=Kribbella sp. NPDC051718 TaxID=3155168 RepID=UPI0034193ADB